MKRATIHFRTPREAELVPVVSDALLGTVAVSDGRGYGLQELLRPHVTLSHARAAWTRLPTSLAAVVIDEREHS